MDWRIALMVVGMATAGAGMAATPEQYAAEVGQWRSERVERLRRPNGWLSLVGLHWLEPGRHRIGSDAGNDIVLAKGPGRLGTIDFEDGTVSLQLAADVPVTIEHAGALLELADGKRLVQLRADTTGQPTVLGFDEAKGSIVLIERAGRYGLRVRQAAAATRTGFTGIDYFDSDPAWRIEARYEPHPPGSTIDIANVVGQLEPMPNPGAVVFERDGRTHRLEAVDEGDGQLFLIFADRTSGKETYGAGRFLYADPPPAGATTVVVDFNRAYNPPCAFNAYSTCPLPPPENRLDLAVSAGEKRYAGPTH